MSQTRILLMILAFLVLTIAPFIWFIATWDSDKEESLSLVVPIITVMEGASA